MRENILNIFKFTLAILLVPVTVLATIEFTRSLGFIPHEYQHWFWVGLATYLVIHLFIFEPEIVYLNGQQVVSGFFKFSPPLAEGIGRTLPLYVILTLIFIAVLKFFPKLEPFKIYAVFAISFFLSMHIIFTARHLTEEEKSGVKPQYFLVTQLIYLFNLILLAAIFNLVFREFSFVKFFQEFISSTSHFYVNLYRQLFIPVRHSRM